MLSFGKCDSERKKHLLDNIPDIWNCKKILYIGASLTRFALGDIIKKNKIQVDVLEISSSRCKELEVYPWINNIIEGDVKEVKNLTTNVYDLIMWIHGPSVLFTKDDVYTSINNLNDLYKHLFVIMCPWGIFSYKSKKMKKGLKDNIKKYDMNKLAFYENDFVNFDFRVSVLGEKDKKGSNLLAWKYK